MWNPFKREIRSNDTPHKEIDTNACTETARGIGLMQKLMNLQGYGPLHQSAFFGAVNLISNSVAQMRWSLKAYDDSEVDESFLRDIIDNSSLTQFMLVKNLIKDCIMHGNGLAYIHRDTKGYPVSIEYLPFGYCNIVYNKATKVLLYQVPSIKNSLIEPINIIHIRMITDDGINGRSLVDYMKNTIKLNASAERAANDFFSSGMTIQGILSTETPRLTKDQREAIRTAWQESQVGHGTGLAVLESGMKYQAISSSSKEAQLLESRLYSVQEIARFFNMSPTLLGDLSKTSYNTLEASQQAFVLNALMPYVSMLEQELTEKLLSYKQKKTLYIDIKEEDIVKSDKISHANYLTTLVNSGLITRNEARKELGYGPVEGGDTLTVSYTDINQNTIGGSGEEDKNTEEEQDE